MRTDPFSDSLAFLIGATNDQQALGPLRLPFAALFALLLVGSVVLAVVNWRRAAEQRRVVHLCIWLFRLLIGCMWFQGAIWKLPLPVSGGLQYWTEQMAENAAFPFFADIVRRLILPNMPIFDPLVLAAELGLAVSYMLGLLVRPVAVLGAIYVLGLWIGLYRNPAEWPWEYMFLAMLQAMFTIVSAGRSLGADALLRPVRPATSVRPASA